MNSSNEIKDSMSYNLGITFKIEVPKSVTDSDFYSLVFRLHNLLMFKESQPYDEISIEANNRNIDEMKNLLDNFYVKSII